MVKLPSGQPAIVLNGNAKETANKLGIQIWLLACRIPFFTPRDGYNHSAMMRQVLCLEIPSVLQRMVTIFPIGNNPSHQDFYEPQGQHNEEIYIREHWDIFTPMEQLFKLLREVSVALIHDIGAFG